MTASLPPGLSTENAAFSPFSRCSNSPFTAMRIAWKDFLQGFFIRRTFCGTLLLMISASSSVVWIGFSSLARTIFRAMLRGKDSSP